MVYSLSLLDASNSRYHDIFGPEPSMLSTSCPSNICPIVENSDRNAEFTPSFPSSPSGNRSYQAATQPVQAIHVQSSKMFESRDLSNSSIIIDERMCYE